MHNARLRRQASLLTPCLIFALLPSLHQRDLAACLHDVGNSLGKLRKLVTVGECVGHLIVHDVPLEILLKNAISETVAEFVDDSIKARFGGVGLPTAIKYLHEVITHSCNMVAVQVHIGETILIGHLCVCLRPVGAILDSGVHECFDFTHVVLCVCVCTYYDSDCLPSQQEVDSSLTVLISEHRFMCVQHKINDLISGRALEAITEPV